MIFVKKIKWPENFFFFQKNMGKPWLSEKYGSQTNFQGDEIKIYNFQKIGFFF